jgi:hypothetical protein
VVVVDDLDEWLDLAALCLASLRHTASDLRRVTFDTGDQGVRVWVGLVSGILRLNDHDLLNYPSAFPLEIRFKTILNVQSPSRLVYVAES